MGHVDASKDVITTKVEDKAGDVKQHATALKEEIEAKVVMEAHVLKDKITTSENIILDKLIKKD